MIVSNSDTGPTIQKWGNQVDEWLSELQAEWEPSVAHEPTVIRDPVHGFIRLHPHEAAILDTPVLQRLRHITQNGLARLVYPGMNHTRFDHTLGVLQTSNIIMDALAYQVSVPPDLRLQVRLAALFHDTGHVLFSHLGEAVLSEMLGHELDAIRTESYRGEPEFFRSHALKDNPAAEILSFLIINAPTFRSTLNAILTQHATVEGVSLTTLDLDVVADIILGRFRADAPRWATDVISGGFDADKMDYILRDCHYSGVRAEVDTTRLIHSLSTVPAGHGDRADRLCILGTGVNYVEQVLFAKLTLYTAVYHHHKVRVTECMFVSIFRELAHALGSGTSALLPRSVGDFLQLMEEDFWSIGSRDPVVGQHVRDLRNRVLWKRALILDRTTLQEESWTKFNALRSRLESSIDRRDEFLDLIYNSVPAVAQKGRHKLWIDFPRPPSVDREAQHSVVRLGGGRIADLSEVAPHIDDWVRTYVVNKMKRHIFYDGEFDARQHVASVAERVLWDRHRIRLDPDGARAGLK